MKPLKEKISITLDGDTLQKIKEKAEAEDRSLSQYINLVLRHHLHPQHLSREYASMLLFSLRYLPYGQRWRYTIR